MLDRYKISGIIVFQGIEEIKCSNSLISIWRKFQFKLNQIPANKEEANAYTIRVNRVHNEAVIIFDMNVWSVVTGRVNVR